MFRYIVDAYEFSSHTTPSWSKGVNDRDFSICLAEVLIEGRRFQLVTITDIVECKIIWRDKIKLKSQKKD